jgi:hypothetical protein
LHQLTQPLPQLLTQPHQLLLTLLPLTLLLLPTPQPTLLLLLKVRLSKLLTLLLPPSNSLLR